MGAAETRGPRTLARLGGDGGARASSPRVRPPQGQCQARVRVPAAAETRAGLGGTSRWSVSDSGQDAGLPRGAQLAAFPTFPGRPAARGDGRLTWSAAA